jgi:hypothetical protein
LYTKCRKILSVWHRESLEEWSHTGICPIEVICGEANGADRLGKQFAKSEGYRVKSFHADWDTHGKSAGPIRNKDMGMYVGADGLLIAFWDGKSRGTKNMIDTAISIDMIVRVIRY